MNATTSRATVPAVGFRRKGRTVPVLTTSDLLRFANDGWVIAADHELKPFLIVASQGPASEYLAFTKAFSAYGDFAYSLAKRGLAALIQDEGRARLDGSIGEAFDLPAAIEREGISRVGATQGFRMCCWKLLRELKKSPRVADLAICARPACGRYMLRRRGSMKYCSELCRQTARGPRDNAATMRRIRAGQNEEIVKVWRRVMEYPDGPVPPMREIKSDLRSRRALPRQTRRSR